MESGETAERAAERRSRPCKCDVGCRRARQAEQYNLCGWQQIADTVWEMGSAEAEGRRTGGIQQGVIVLLETPGWQGADPIFLSVYVSFFFII